MKLARIMDGKVQQVLCLKCGGTEFIKVNPGNRKESQMRTDGIMHVFAVLEIAGGNFDETTEKYAKNNVARNIGRQAEIEGCIEFTEEHSEKSHTLKGELIVITQERLQQLLKAEQQILRWERYGQ